MKKNKIPRKYRIISTILIIPMIIVLLVSIFTPFNLMSIPGVIYFGVFLVLCGEFVLQYGIHKGKVNNRSQ